MRKPRLSYFAEVGGTTWKVRRFFDSVVFSSSRSIRIFVSNIQSHIFQTSFCPLGSVVRSRRSQAIAIPPLHELPRTEIVESRMIATEAIFIYPSSFKAFLLLCIARTFAEEGALSLLWRSLFLLSSQLATRVRCCHLEIVVPSKFCKILPAGHRVCGSFQRDWTPPLWAVHILEIQDRLRHGLPPYDTIGIKKSRSHYSNRQISLDFFCCSLIFEGRGKVTREKK